MDKNELNDTIAAAFGTYFDERECEYIGVCALGLDDAPATTIIHKFAKMFRFYIEHDRLPTYDELGV